MAETMLQCRNDHEFLSSARPRQNLKCPVCKVSVWVRVPTEAPEPAQWAGVADALPKLGYTTGDPCPACGDERDRSPRGDLMGCYRCDDVGLPTATVEHATRPAAGVRSGATPDDAIMFDANRAAMLQRLHHQERLDWLDPEEWAVAWGDREHVTWWRTVLTGLAARIAEAGDGGELGEWSSKYDTAVREGLDGHPTLDDLRRNRGIGSGVAGQVAITLPAEPLAIAAGDDEDEDDEYDDAEVVTTTVTPGEAKLGVAVMAVAVSTSINPALGIVTGLALLAGGLMSKRRATAAARVAEAGPCENCGKPAVRRLLTRAMVVEYGYGRFLQVLLCAHGMLGRGTRCEMWGRKQLALRGLTPDQVSMEAL